MPRRADHEFPVLPPADNLELEPEAVDADACREDVVDARRSDVNVTNDEERQFVRELGQHVGQWVAVEGYAIVAAAATFDDLTGMIGEDSEAMVYEVPDLAAGEPLILGIA